MLSVSKQLSITGRDVLHCNAVWHDTAMQYTASSLNISGLISAFD